MRRGNVEGSSDVDAEEAGLRHADDVERVAVEHDGPPDDRRIAAVLLLPERVAQHDAGCRAAFAIVGRRQHAADVRRHAERLKEIAADPDPLCGSRLTAAGQVERHGAPGEHFREGLLALAHGAPQRFGHESDAG